MQLNTTEQFGLKCYVTFEWRLCSRPLSARRPTRQPIVLAWPNPTGRWVSSSATGHCYPLPVTVTCPAVECLQSLTGDWCNWFNDMWPIRSAPCGAGAVRTTRQQRPSMASSRPPVTHQWLVALDGWTSWTDVADESVWQLQYHTGWFDGMLSQTDETAHQVGSCAAAFSDLCHYKLKLQTKQQVAEMAR